MHKTIRLSFLLAFLMLFCQLGYSMEKVVGSGKIITEDRQISKVRAIQLSGFGQVSIEQGKEEKLSIQTDDNILPFISSEIDDGYLMLGIKKSDSMISVQPSKTIQYYITVKDLENIRLSGSGNITSKNTLHVDDLEVEINGAGNIALNVDTKELETEIAGAGNVEIKGNVETQEIEIMGSGNYMAYELTSKEADVKIMGAGDVKVQVSDKLDCKIYGSGSIFYKGSPEVTQKIYGSGSVKQVS